MKHTLTSKAAELMRKNGRHRRWRRAFSGMAAVVVFITTYMLILPAITMENKAICGMAEHTHTDACYEMQLVCTQEETPEGADVHVHGPECYEQQQVLTCTKQEGEGHTHTDACYGYVCGQEESAGHTHTDACYTEVTHRELTCTEPESAGHTHGDGCYDEEGKLVCTEAESTGHTHGDSCYTETVTRELTCGQEESSGHTHTDACIGLICGQEEYEGHTHTDACYTTEDVLVCTEPTGHTHGDGCYEKVLVCDVPEHTHTEECYPAAEPEEPQEPELICTLPEHSHEDACYDADGNLICGMEEHTHTEECYAPVEIPEEETPTTAFPDEKPEGYVEYTFENEEEGLSILVYAPENAFGDQKVDLFAEVLPEGSEGYIEAQENLEKAENAPEYTGMAAMDIRFVDAAAEDPAQAEEIEPDAEMGQVFVKIDAKALLPEDVDESTLAVQHHAKVSDGGIFGTGILEHTDVVVETVADISEETGDITATPGETALPETLPALADEPETEEAATLEEPAAETEETQPAAMNVEAEFAVNSFSKFTITWGNSDLTVHVMVGNREIDVTELESRKVAGSSSWTEIRTLLSNNNLLSFTADDGKLYTYDSARDSNYYYYANEVHYIRYNNGWKYSSTGSGAGSKLSELYVFYSLNSALETFKGLDTSDIININLFNYSATNDYTGINTNHTFKFTDGAGKFTYNGHEVARDAINVWTGKNAGVRTGIVGNTLDSETGHPILSSSSASLSYLFDESTVDGKVSFTGANNLFQRDADGYYYYNSGMNFASLDVDNTFNLYNTPRSIGYVDRILAQFLPFNTLSKRTDTGTNTEDNTSYQYYKLNESSGEDTGEDYWFGMTIDFDFQMPRGGMVENPSTGADEAMVFTFEGDDDVWVFLNDTLVLDMGGIHDNFEGSINFQTGVVTVNGKTQGNLVNLIGDDWQTAYKNYELKFYYLERGQGGSNCRIEFNIPAIPNNSLTVEKEVTTDDSDALTLLGDFKYQFQVVDKDGALLVNKDDPYDIYKGSVKVGTGKVGEDGIFTLQAGQKAVFTKDSTGKAYEWLADDAKNEYFVRELLEDGYIAQYGDIQYEITGGSGGQDAGHEENLGGNLEGFTGFKSGALTGEMGNGYVVFTNQISTQNLSKLYIEKELTPGTNDTGETFNMYVTINGVPLPEGTQYTIVGSKEPSTVTTTGIIPLGAGETALLLNGDKNGIVAGTVYTVVEQGADNYTVSYSAEERHKSDPDDPSSEWSPWVPVALTQLGEGGVQGTVVNVASETTVTVTNSDYDKAATLDILKCLEGADNESHTFDFQVREVEYNEETNTYTPKPDGRDDVIQITGVFDEDTPQTATVYFGYKSNVSGTFYYEISEKPGTETGVSYDTTKYIIKADVANGTAKLTQVYPAPANSGISTMSVETTDSEIDLRFTNSLTGSLSITKTVTYNGDPKYTSNAVFAFDVTVEGASGDGYTVTYGNLTWDEVKSYTGWPVGTNALPTTANFSAGKATVYVPAGATLKIDGLPAAAQATITETTTDGYAVSWSGDTATTNDSKTASITTKPISEDPVVICTNTTGAVLPSTGGMGTTPFLALGTLLTLGAGMLLVQRRRKEGSDAV